MSLALAGFITSIVALVISIWTRLETFFDLRERRRIDIVKRLGDALNESLKAQDAYRTAFTIRVIRGNRNSSTLGDPMTADELELRLDEMTELSQEVEAILRKAQNGQVGSLNRTIMEAQIALLHKHRHDVEQALSVLQRENGRAT